MDNIKTTNATCLENTAEPPNNISCGNSTNAATSSDARDSSPASTSKREQDPGAQAQKSALPHSGSHTHTEEHNNGRTPPNSGTPLGMSASTPNVAGEVSFIIPPNPSSNYEPSLPRTRSGIQRKDPPKKRLRAASGTKAAPLRTTTSRPVTIPAHTPEQEATGAIPKRINTDISDSLFGLHISQNPPVSRIVEQPQSLFVSGHNTFASAVTSSLSLPNVRHIISDNHQRQQSQFGDNNNVSAITSGMQRPNDYRSGSSLLFTNAVSSSNFAPFTHSFANTNSTFCTGMPILSTVAPEPTLYSSAFPYCAPNYSLLGHSAISVHNSQPQPQIGMLSSANPSSSFHNTFAPHQPSFLNHSTADITLSASQISARHAINKDLPNFSGRPDEWPIFITNYVQSTERCGFTDQENLIRLQKCLKGPALEAVRGKLMVPSTVPFAIETLRMLYGRPDIIHHTLQLKLKQEPPVRKENLQTLINLALSVQNYRTTLQAIGLSDYLNDPMLLNELVEKLPGDLKLDWGRFRVTLARANIEVFDGWLFSLATCASQVTSYTPTGTTEELKGKGKTLKQHIFVHDVAESNDNKSSQTICCPKCTKGHRLWECSDFTSLKVNDRWSFVKEKRLCLRCFRNHYIRRCNSKKQCGVDGCSMAHNPLLHTSNAKKTTYENQSASKPMEDNKSLLLHVNEKRKSLFRYIPVTLFGKTETVDVYALIDEGSACTIMDNEVALKLGLDGPTEELCLQWTGEVTQNEENSKIVSVDISAREPGQRKFRMRNVRTVSSLDLPEQSLHTIDLENCRQLNDLPLHTYNAVKAQILIGIDNANLGVPLDVRESTENSLIAVRCRLGWSVYGRHGVNDSSVQKVMHLCPCNKYDTMDNELKNYFSLETVGVKAASPISAEDERANKIMTSTTKYLAGEKRWQTGLLWKYNNIELPDSLAMARRRLFCLESKMTRDPQLKEFLIGKMRDYENKGYIKKLEKREVTSGGKSWYIPFFTVFNKNKNKVRLVWDAAAVVNDISLNSVLLKGPDLLKSLTGVLMRFREHPFALCGDIREMYHQIRITPEDQKAQYFLWRYGDSSKEIDTYSMTVMTFGASCSPTLANYIKNKNAERFRDEEPAAVNAIIENTYVDDWLQSADSEKTLLHMAKVVRKIHFEGGFEMRNWLSNSQLVRCSLSGDPGVIKKCIEDPESKFEKVLGMMWLTNSDELAFAGNFSNINFNETASPTKRKILQIVMTIYDPLGLLGFFVIYVKILLQEIWRSGVQWDETVNESEREKWLLWVRLLPSISELRIPRCISLASCCHNLQMHVFVDASINAYAAVVYLRAEQGMEVKCNLVASKTRVAPLKPVSIPRLELMAAVLGLRLAKFVAGELSVQLISRTFWTDSRNVLCWIRSDVRKYHQFVALRIGEIVEDSKVNEWRWVPSAMNVADLGTKWGKHTEFKVDTPWFTGPRFLVKPEHEWPTTSLPDIAGGGHEMVHHIGLKTSTISILEVITPDINRFGKWEKLRNTQQYLLQFLRLIRKTPMKCPELRELWNMPLFESAEVILMRKCQEEEFTEEIKCLRSNKQVNRRSVIYKSSPYLDKTGLLRVKGRIDAARGISPMVKRPIIMPRNHPLTYLLVDFYHRRFHHHHNEIVVNEMRQRFWIHGLRALVRNTSKKCQFCKNRRALPSVPEMGSLPLERLQSFAVPFYHTGVDYFGPMDVVVGRRREKRWGVLFTCMTVRAVHIEVASSLSTDTFLMVLKQFISRRGVPRQIISDNGTNFRGASRVLMNEIEKVCAKEVVNKHPEIEWRFIPPASPHMGGTWERMVRSVKSILTEILPQAVVKEEVLRAALADIENILNSRPLTYVPVDSAESEALTPNHFLIGSSNGIRERGNTDGSGVTLSKSFRISSALANQFWKRWVHEYLPCLTRRTKWHDKICDPIAINDVVIIVDENTKRNTWNKGIVVDVHRSKEGQVRSAVVKTVNGLLTRPAVKLAKLDIKK